MSFANSEDDVRRARLDHRDCVADRAGGIRQIGIDDDDDAASCVECAATNHRAETVAVARIDDANIERKAGRLQVALDGFERIRQLGALAVERHDDRDAGRRHDVILIR